MTSIVVTGASGFLGRAVVAGLSGLGFEVIAVSRQAGPSLHQVGDYRACPVGDVLIHLAEDPDRGKVNDIGEVYVRESLATAIALSKRCNRMIYASSGLVYGDQGERPFAIDMPVVESDAYCTSKLLNERIVLDSGGVAVRLSNLIGDGMAANNVVSEILRQVPGSGPVRVRDDKPVRDYLHVRDAATAFVRLIASSCHGIVNVGSGVGTSVRALARFALAAAGQEEREIVSTAPALRRSVNILDISATRQALDWSPSSSLAERISQLIHNKVSPASWAHAR